MTPAALGRHQGSRSLARARGPVVHADPRRPGCRRRQDRAPRRRRRHAHLGPALPEGRAGPRHRPGHLLHRLQPQQALGHHRHGDARRPGAAAARWPRRPTSWSRTSRPAGSGSTASTTRACAPLNPRLIYCSVTGFGHDGPHASRAGYDLMIQATSGMMSITGRPDDEPGGGPLRVGVALTDLFTGVYAATAILAALEVRHRTGEGQHIDMALLDVGMAILANQASAFLNTGVAPQRQGNSHPSLAPYQDFHTKDGAMLLAIGNNGQFARFCEAAGHADWAERPALCHQHAARAEPRGADPADGGRHAHAHHRRVDRAAGRQGRALRPDQRHRPGLRGRAGQGARPRGDAAARMPATASRTSWASPARCACRARRRCCGTRRRRWGSTPTRCWPRWASTSSSARRCARPAWSEKRGVRRLHALFAALFAVNNV